MADPITLARPYARAAFELAQADGSLAPWSQSLQFAALVAAQPEVAALNGDPRLSTASRLALYLPEGEGADSAFGRFLGALAEKGRLGLLPQVSELYDRDWRESQSRLLVKVTSAVALETDQVERLSESLARRFQRKIDLDIKIDPALIGGAIIDADGDVIDGSVRGRLARLSSTLTH